MHELLKKYNNKGYTVTVRELDLIGNENYRPQLRRVRLSGDKNIVLGCSADILPEVLKQAQQVGLLTDQFQFIITSLDMHTIDLEPFQHSGTNITGARMISPDDPFVKEITDFFIEKHKSEKESKEKTSDDDDDDDENEDNEDGDNDEEEEEPDENKENNEDDENNENEDEDSKDTDENEEEEDEIPEGLTPDKMRLDTALTFDAVLLFSQIVKISDSVRSKSIKCDDDSQQRAHGISDIMAMKTVNKRRVKGLTGSIHFDQKGHRSEFLAEIIELASDGIQKVGVWNSTDSEIYLTRSHDSLSGYGDEMSLRNKSFIVLTALVREPDNWL